MNVSFPSLLCYVRWPQVRIRLRPSQSSCRHTAPACTITTAMSTSTRLLVLLDVVWAWRSSTRATPCRSIIGRALLPGIKTAPVQHFEPTPSSTTQCFDTASSSSITYNEYSIPKYHTMRILLLNCYPRIRQCFRGNMPLHRMPPCATKFLAVTSSNSADFQNSFINKKDGNFQ